MRTQIEVEISVRFTTASNAEMFVEKMNKIQQINPYYKWDMHYNDDNALVTFKVTTYEEYEAITTKSALMSGSVSSEINLMPIYDFIDEDIKKRVIAKNKTKNRAKKKEEDAFADAA